MREHEGLRAEFEIFKKAPTREQLKGFLNTYALLHNKQNIWAEEICEVIWQELFTCCVTWYKHGGQGKSREDRSRG